MSRHNSKQDPKIRRHNETVYQQLKEGDLIEFHRGVYSHWAVYVGNGSVVHLAGEDNDGINGKVRPEHLFTISGKTFNKACVCLDDFWNVVLDSMVYINNQMDKKRRPMSADEIVENALSRLGEVGYSLITKNCEHFAKWCRYGVEKSNQVDNALTGIGVGVAFGAALGAITAIAKYWGSNAQTEEEEEDE